MTEFKVHVAAKEGPSGIFTYRIERETLQDAIDYVGETFYSKSTKEVRIYGFDENGKELNYKPTEISEMAFVK